MTKEILQGTATKSAGVDVSQQAEETLNRVSEFKAMRDNRTKNIIANIAKQAENSAKLEGTIDELNGKLEELNKLRDRDQQLSDNKISTIQSEHEAEMARYHEAANGLYKQIDALKAEITRLRSFKTASEEKMSEAEDKIAQAEKTKSEMEDHIKEIEDNAERRVARSVAQAQTLIERTKKGFQVKEQRLVATIRSERESADLARQDADRRVEKMTSLLEEERARNANLEEDHQCLLRDSERMAVLLNRLQGTVDALLNEEVNLASELEGVHRDLQEAEEQSNAVATRPTTLLKSDNLASLSEFTACARGSE